MKHDKTESWYQNATLYQIYPLSFADSNGDGYGDIRGIIDHLEYLGGNPESIGVGALWLSPIYASGMCDWGYDITDHCAIDPVFGTMEDFDQLVDEVHSRGMKLLLDYVANHTSDKHPWFIEARSSLDNPKRDWYIWANPSSLDGKAPNNWLSHFGGSAWTFDAATGQYYLHSFYKEQPDLNWRNPEVQEAMLNVLRFWLEKGVDGFRADAVYGLIKDEQLRNDPINPAYRPGVSNPAMQFLRVHSQGQQSLGKVMNSFCNVIASKPNTFLLSEAYLNIAGLSRMYDMCREHPIHAPFNFNLMTLKWSAKGFRNFIDEYEASLGPEDWPNYVLGNHDNHRVATRIGAQRARLMAMLQLTLRGLPVVYYGEELGLEDVPIKAEDVRDPIEARVPGFHLGRDGARVPMPWNTDYAAGFTTVKPWLPINKDYRHVAVSVEERDGDSTLNLYRHLIHLRNTCSALSTGDYRSVDVGTESVFAYIRENKMQRFLIILNFDSHSMDVTIKRPVGDWVAGTHQVMGNGSVPEGDKLTLEPFEGRVYEIIQGGKR